MTTAAEKPRPETREITAVVQGITERTITLDQEDGSIREQAYITMETRPRPNMRYPDKYNIWNKDLVEGLLGGGLGIKVGDTVLITLALGKPKKDKPDEHWWDVVGIARAGTEAPKVHPKPETILPAKPPIPLQQQEAELDYQGVVGPAKISPGEWEAAIAQAHDESMRAAAYTNAVAIAVAQATLSKDSAHLDMAKVKKLANDFWLVITGK